MTKAVRKGAIRKSALSGPLGLFPKRHLLLATAVSLVVGLLIAWMPSSKVEANKTSIPLQIDAYQEMSPADDLVAITATEPTRQPLAEVEAIQPEAQNASERWQSLVIQNGDSLSTLFSDMGLSARLVYNISQTPTFGKLLADIRPGQTLEFKINRSNELTDLRYVRSRLSSIVFSKDEEGYSAEEILREPELRTAYVEGTITDSLFLTSQRAGLTDRLTMELAAIFGWDIDFALDIRKGDRFSVVYEEFYLDGQKLRNGEILSATFINQGKDYTALRYTDTDGRSSYFNPEGKSMKKAFLRTPVAFSHISSKFNPNRLHPIFKTRRPHRGVDYAASSGTPIKAAGDGRIKFSGWQKGYGNVTYIEHPNNIVTVYAHQSKLNKRFKKGNRVRQGDIIGYVGQTGWATGPHLHYEFQVNGVHRNPVTVKLPDAKPVPASEIDRFKQHASTRLAQLKQHQATMLASQ